MKHEHEWREFFFQTDYRYCDNPTCHWLQDRRTDELIDPEIGMEVAQNVLKEMARSRQRGKGKR